MYWLSHGKTERGKVQGLKALVALVIIGGYLPGNAKAVCGVCQLCHSGKTAAGLELNAGITDAVGRVDHAPAFSLKGLIKEDRVLRCVVQDAGCRQFQTSATVDHFAAERYGCAVGFNADFV